MPRVKKPRRASLDEVKITREGDTAIIENADPLIGGMHLRLGAKVQQMSDLEILKRFNEIIAAQEESLRRYDNTVIEIPIGKPQVKFSDQCDQWVPVGDVLRCFVEDNEDGEAVIWIDDQELSLREFGRLLTTRAGWGMRISFVPEELVTEEPELEVREPRKDER